MNVNHRSATVTPLGTDHALSDFPSVHSPPRLLRFFSPRNLPLLINGLLRVTPPSEFNDPFEFNAAIPKVPPSIDQMRKWLLAENSYLRQSYEAKHPEYYSDWVEKVALKESQHWLQSLRHLSEGYARGISQAYGICCFMNLTDEEFTSPDIVHFWDRYAHNHKGFVVAFNSGTGFLKLIQKALWLFPVNYYPGERRSVIDPSELTTDDSAMLRYLRKIAAEKCATWAAEREWRLIVSLADNPRNPVTRKIEDEKILYFLDLWRYVPRKHQGKEFSAVYLGHRASKELTESVLAACSQSRLSHVSVFRAKPSDHDYSFSYELLKGSSSPAG